MHDPFDLSRFVDAQENTFRRALEEVTQGRKQSHWMWYIFPQAAGLGYSEMSQRYAIRSAAEAAAYLAHPILGPRLIEISGAMLLHRDKTARQILGSPDDLKLRSCMSLFAAIPGAPPVFSDVLTAFYGA
jgi:uncharacterized protein (DUF1810 family)